MYALDGPDIWELGHDVEVAICKSLQGHETILVTDVNSRMTGSWSGHEDDRVMDDRGRMHIRAGSH